MVEYDENLSAEAVSEIAKTPRAFVPARVAYLMSGTDVASCPPFRAGYDNPTAPPIFYKQTELVTREDEADEVARLLPDFGGGERCDIVTGSSRIVVFTVQGDALAVARALKRRNPELSVGPHHVLTLAQTWKVGPGDDPRPVADKWQAGAAVDGKPPVVGVIDTGIWKQPDAVGIEDAQQAADPEPLDVDPKDNIVDWYGAGHGGFIAGVVASRAANIPVVTENAIGADGLTELNVVKQVDEAIANRDAVIINLSLGSYGDEDGGADLVVLSEAMERWKAANVLLVAAAGNDGVANRHYPAAFAEDPRYADCVVAVGALETRAGADRARPADFSNHGSWVTAWAPGVDIVSHYPEGMSFLYRKQDGSPLGTAQFANGLACWSGTSFAAPFVAAEIAKHAADGRSSKEAWADLRQGRPFVVFWPDLATRESASGGVRQTY